MLIEKRRRDSEKFGLGTYSPSSWPQGQGLSILGQFCLKFKLDTYLQFLQKYYYIYIYTYHNICKCNLIDFFLWRQVLPFIWDKELFLFIFSIKWTQIWQKLHWIGAWEIFNYQRQKQTFEIVFSLVCRTIFFFDLLF